MANKIIISCAITGSIHTPTMSDALPFTPDQIATQAIDAAKAGAAILHLHARDPNDGRPSGDPNVFMQFLPRIKQATDAVVNITTGGAVTMTVDERICGGQDAVAGNVLAQYGLDEFRALSDGEALQELEIRLGGEPIWSIPTPTSSPTPSATSRRSTKRSARAMASNSSTNATMSGTSIISRIASTAACSSRRCSCS